MRKGILNKIASAVIEEQIRENESLVKVRTLGENSNVGTAPRETRLMPHLRLWDTRTLRSLFLKTLFSL